MTTLAGISASILLVEDDSIIGAYIASSLNKLGYRVSGPVASGEEAIERSGVRRPDLVLMDIALAGDIDGIEAATQIRVRHGVPVIFLTAHADTPTMARAKAAEPFGYLAKPFQIASLHATIEMALYKHALTERLRDSEALYHLMFTEHSAAQMLIEPESGQIVAANAAAALFYGYSTAELQRMNIAQINTMDPDDIARLRTQAAQHSQNQFVFTHRLASGELRDVEVHSSPIRQQGRTLLYSIIHDVTDRRRAEAELKAERDFARLVMDSLGQGLTITGPGSRLEFVNPAYAQMVGNKPSAMIGQRPADFTVAEDEAQLNQANADRRAGRTTTYETRLRHASGRMVPVTITGVPHRRNGEIVGSISVITDLTEYKALTERLREANQRLVERIADNERLQKLLADQAVHDPLTGLYNRRYLSEALARELPRAARDGNPLSLVMVDIDHFKTVNDTFGHKAGDEALCALANLLHASTRAGDFVCRYGGEEFLIVMYNTSARVAAGRAETWRDAIAALAIPMALTTSIGVADYPTHADSIETLIDAVDGALYRAKQEGRNCVRVAG